MSGFVMGGLVGWACKGLGWRAVGWDEGGWRWCLSDATMVVSRLDALPRGDLRHRQPLDCTVISMARLQANHRAPPKVLTANYKARPDPLCRGAERLAGDSQTLHDALATSKTAQMIIS